jgi:hypothetical protein
MQFRKALWPSDGCVDAIMHAEPTSCGMVDFSTGTTDESVIAAWNTRPSPVPGPRCGEMERALARLAAAEANYRHAHDLRGDDHKETGRAWEAMRRAGDAARDMIAQARAARTGKDAT